MAQRPKFVYARSGPSPLGKDNNVIISLLACCAVLAATDTSDAVNPTLDGNLNAAALLQASQQALDAANAARDAALALQKFAEGEAPKPPPSDWVFLTTGRLESVSGNAKSFTGGLDAAASGAWHNWTSDLKLSFAYGQTWGSPGADSKPTAFQFATSARGERKYTHTFGTYALIGFLMDRVASIQDQEYGELGASNTWLDIMRDDWVLQRLRTSVGFRATREAHGNFYPPAPEDPANAVTWIYGPTITVNYRLGLTAHAFFTEDATLLFDVETSRDVRVTSDTALNMQLNSQLAVALTLKVRYIGRPADGRQPTDTIIGTNATWNW